MTADDQPAGPVTTPDKDHGVLARLGPRRLAVVVAAGLVPWVVLPFPQGTTAVHSFGLVNPNPSGLLPTVTPLPQYVFLYTGRLPFRLLLWPLSTLSYVLALVSLGLASLGREDRRVTTGLFALAGLAVLYYAVAYASFRSVTALPFGVAALWLAAWTSRPRAILGGSFRR